jgi:hypothetical protein
MLETRNENTAAVVKPVLGRTGVFREDIKLIVNKSDFRLRFGHIWFRTEISGGLL